MRKLGSITYDCACNNSCYILLIIKSDVLDYNTILLFNLKNAIFL
jgi:hypothetical protein